MPRSQAARLIAASALASVCSLGDLAPECPVPWLNFSA